MNMTKKKSLNDRDATLLTTVERFGGLPQKRGEKGPFWEKVFNELKSEFGWTNPHAPRHRYNRIMRKIRDLETEPKKE